ncbi:hypothetical protein [Acinetobacter variabilis]|uniref:Uncharacterized protein n=1 Tax=Acinetobacter variabilis TaxID=70346 RepID=N8VKF8_9GAMM|nr:hypothetical protein [Acinetobacter variabilis]ENV00402.1 hypothetical protein F969_00634 [Acinetobacter variabilis]
MNLMLSNVTTEQTEALNDLISKMENDFIDRHFLSEDEAGQLEALIANAMKLGELYALQKFQAAKPPAGTIKD